MSKTTAKAGKKAAVGKKAAKAVATVKTGKARPLKAAAKSKAVKVASKAASAKPLGNRALGKKQAAVAKPAAAKPVTERTPARTVAAAKSVASKKSEGAKKKMAPPVKIADIVLPLDFRPSENEPFMNDMHRAYFRKRLIEWKDEILRQTRETLAILHEDSTQHADLADRATSETDRATELRTRDRQRKLIAKIDAALGRIEDGSYGYCEDTGEPIGLKRLDARPIATLSVEAQERHERRERVYREE